eukprot:TRINITY_DN15188_c0_g1_i1.p1 TRINITY_DN15188_c0_g1~~TRINITY_DN15188_c0_g1_i1.p1  ORF type:complete len:264 (+),score=36.68 TRINITY_DN15188_c0_g1_i1:132-923(+)
MSADPKVPVVVVSTTFFPNNDNIRLSLALDFIRACKKEGLDCVVCDASPEPVQQLLMDAGAVVIQQHDTSKRKGGALREAIQGALALIYREHEWGVVAFQEAEKVDCVRFQRDIAEPIIRGESDIVIPSRNRALFETTYPREQVHSESFGNMFINQHVKEAGIVAHSSSSDLDWLFGPFALHSRLARRWVEYDGTLWDAQIVPIIHSIRVDKAIVLAREIDYHHAVEMLEEEQGLSTWCDKRLFQLNQLLPLVRDAVRSEART